MGVKERRDWLIARVPQDNFVKEEALVSATCYEHAIPWMVGEEDLRIVLGVGKLVALRVIGDDYLPYNQIWRPGPSFDDAQRKQAEGERAWKARLLPLGVNPREREALAAFQTLEGPDKKPVERNAFKEALIKAKLTDEEAEKAIRMMFREGRVYESKPGLLRRLES